MEPYLTTAPGRIDMHVRGARFASYKTDGAVPGFTSLLAGGLRSVTQADRAVGLCLWLGHGNVNGAAFGVSEDGNSGRIVTDDLLARRGSQSVGFLHECHWIAPDGERFLNESRTVRVVGGPSAGALLDIDIVMTPCAADTIILGRSNSGLLSICIATSLLPDAGGQMRNSIDDFGPAAMNGRQASWCAANGVVDGETVGIAILDHPENPWHPSPWVCTDDGLLSPCPFPWRTFELKRDAPLRVKYRVVVHTGYVEAGWVHQRLRDWVNERR